MSERRLVDTNVIVRHLVQDNPRQVAAAGRIIDACDRGELTLVLLPAVLAECTFVLESFYEHPRADIARALTALITSPGIELLDLPVHVDALARYCSTKLHFVDCLIAATAAAQRVPVATFDGDYRRFHDVTVKID